jgi:hypothetical protein
VPLPYCYTNLWACEIKTMFVSYLCITFVAAALMKEPDYRNIDEMLDYFYLEALMI